MRLTKVWNDCICRTSIVILLTLDSSVKENINFECPQYIKIYFILLFMIFADFWRFWQNGYKLSRTITVLQSVFTESVVDVCIISVPIFWSFLTENWSCDTYDMTPVEHEIRVCFVSMSALWVSDFLSMFGETFVIIIMFMS